MNKFMSNLMTKIEHNLPENRFGKLLFRDIVNPIWKYFSDRWLADTARALERRHSGVYIMKEDGSFITPVSENLSGLTVTSWQDITDPDLIARLKKIRDDNG